MSVWLSGNLLLVLWLQIGRSWVQSMPITFVNPSTWNCSDSEQIWADLSGSEQILSGSEQFWADLSGFWADLLGSDQFWSVLIRSGGARESTGLVQGMNVKRSPVIDSQFSALWKRYFQHSCMYQILTHLFLNRLPIFTGRTISSDAPNGMWAKISNTFTHQSQLRLMKSFYSNWWIILPLPLMRSGSTKDLAFHSATPDMASKRSVVSNHIQHRLIFFRGWHRLYL